MTGAAAVNAQTADDIAPIQASHTMAAHHSDPLEQKILWHELSKAKMFLEYAELDSVRRHEPELARDDLQQSVAELTQALQNADQSEKPEIQQIHDAVQALESPDTTKEPRIEYAHLILQLHQLLETV